MELNHDSSNEEEDQIDMRPVFIGKNAIKEPSTPSTTVPSESLKPTPSKQSLAASTSKLKTSKAKTAKKSKEKSVLTNKFKALLAANLKKHSLKNV